MFQVKEIIFGFHLSKCSAPSFSAHKLCMYNKVPESSYRNLANNHNVDELKMVHRSHDQFPSLESILVVIVVVILLKLISLTITTPEFVIYLTAFWATTSVCLKSHATQKIPVINSYISPLKVTLLMFYSNSVFYVSDISLIDSCCR